MLPVAATLDRSFLPFSSSEHSRHRASQRISAQSVYVQMPKNFTSKDVSLPIVQKKYLICFAVKEDVCSCRLTDSYFYAETVSLAEAVSSPKRRRLSVEAKVEEVRIFFPLFSYVYDDVA